MGSEEGRSSPNNFTLHGVDWDVLEVAVRCWDGFERGWTPHGGDGDMLMGEDEDVEAADEGVSSREGAVVSWDQGRVGEVEKMEDLEAVVGFYVDDGVSDVGGS